jgi:hypothetical protein
MSDLNLAESKFVKTRGDLILYGSWFGEDLRPCLVVIPAVRANPVPLVVDLDTAYKWNPDDRDVDPRGAAFLVMQFLQCNGMSYANPITHMRVISLIHDHLGDLLAMPPKPTSLIVVADAFRTDIETGKTVHSEIVKYV